MSQVDEPWLVKDGLRVGHLNINHLYNKRTEIPSILSNYGKKIHIFGFSESHLTQFHSDDDLKIHN